MDPHYLFLDTCMTLSQRPDSCTRRLRFSRRSRNVSQSMTSMRSFFPFVNWMCSVPFTRPALSPCRVASSIARSTLMGCIGMCACLRRRRRPRPVDGAVGRYLIVGGAARLVSDQPRLRDRPLQSRLLANGQQTWEDLPRLWRPSDETDVDERDSPEVTRWEGRPWTVGREGHAREVGQASVEVGHARVVRREGDARQ